MNLFSSFLSQLPMYILSLPVLLMAFSVHESAHGYAALKLGDPTARNLGRITLNPVKHLDLMGTICMLFFHVGWAKPVPINARYFKKPKRDMAITGAAGPLSNLCLSLIHLVILRIAMIFISNICYEESMDFFWATKTGGAFTGSLSFTILSLVVYLLYLGVILNISLAVFNLIPVPPFDGSRIFYAFLPTKLYFGVMKYERIIMLVFLVLIALGALAGPLHTVLAFLSNGLFSLAGLWNMDGYAKGEAGTTLINMLNYVNALL